jgi:hypothetical protein
MGPGPIVVEGIRPQSPAKVRFAEYDRVIGAFSADRTNDPFYVSVLPRRPGCSRMVLNTKTGQAPFEYGAIAGVAITVHENWVSRGIETSKTSAKGGVNIQPYKADARNAPIAHMA